jgi:flagellar protein FlaF
MVSYEKKLKSYQRRQVPAGGSPQFTEAWALIEAARRMAVSIGGGDPGDKETRRNMKAAVRLNWRLWTIFQAELTRDDSPLPADLRVNMLTLCQFVDRHTISCLAEPTPEKLRALIDVNRHIGSGLMGSTSDDAAEDRAIKEAAGIAAAPRQPAPAAPAAEPAQKRFAVDV